MLFYNHSVISYDMDMKDVEVILISVNIILIYIYIYVYRSIYKNVSKQVLKHYHPFIPTIYRNVAQMFPIVTYFHFLTINRNHYFPFFLKNSKRLTALLCYFCCVVLFSY